MRIVHEKKYPKAFPVTTMQKPGFHVRHLTYALPHARELDGTGTWEIMHEEHNRHYAMERLASVLYSTRNASVMLPGCGE
jgi:hypothetical protein